MIKKLFNSEFFIGRSDSGYRLCRKITFFGLHINETLDLCRDKKSLDESLKILGITPSECTNYPEN